MEESVTEEYPSLRRRFQSVFIDNMVIITCMIIFSQFLGNDENSNSYIKGILLFALFFIYEPFCMSFGCSIGNRLSGIRVRDEFDRTKRIDIVRSYIRFIVKIFLGIISFFTVTSDQWKRAIHDKVAGSVMVYKK